MPHATLLKFGYPESTVRDLRHWSVLLRPAQATLGALVLVARAPVTAFADLPDDAFAELQTAIRGIEAMLAAALGYDKINYLMLMMLDREVHFHVLPRHAAPRDFAGATFTDPGWPGPPALGHANPCCDAVRAALLDRLRANWPDRRG